MKISKNSSLIVVISTLLTFSTVAYSKPYKKDIEEQLSIKLGSIEQYKYATFSINKNLSIGIASIKGPELNQSFKKIVETHRGLDIINEPNSTAYGLSLESKF